MNVALLIGGRSVEHDSSIYMYYYFLELIRKSNNESILLKYVYYQALDGIIYVHCVDDLSNAPSNESELCKGRAIHSSNLPARLREGKCFLFSLLQGSEGEDGVFQGMACSSDLWSNLGTVFPSAVSMNKWVQNLIAAQLLKEFLTPIDTAILSTKASAADLFDVLKRFANRACVLKPNNLGASVFCDPVQMLTIDTLIDYQRSVFDFDTHFLVQERIYGRELSCGCLRIEDQTVVLPIVELYSSSNFMGRAEKFSKCGYRLCFVQDDNALQEKIAESSKRLFDFVGYDTTCRFDYLVGQEGELYFLEANSKPGLTEESHYTLMLERAGYSLLDLIKISANNYRSRHRLRCDYRYEIQKVFQL